MSMPKAKVAVKPAPAATPKADAPIASEALASRFRVSMKRIAASLIERDGEVEMMFTALVCREHVLLVGPPGCAKSLLCQQLAASMGGVRYWQRQLTKFTEPGEVIGPVDIAALKAGRMERLIDGMMPTAEVAFLDEVFKANSAILNSLLLLLNERQCDVGGARRVSCPLAFCMGASNEWPESREELGALFDRFLFRKAVVPIRSRAGLKRLVSDPTVGAPPPALLSAADVEAAHAQAMALPFSDAASDTFFRIVGDLRKAGVTAGDRRLRKAWAACKAAAWLEGGVPGVLPHHLAVLADVLWEEPAEQPHKCAEIVLKLADPALADVQGARREAAEVIDALDGANDAQMRAAVTKLVEIGKTRLARHAGRPDADAAREWLTAEINALRAAALESTASAF